MNYSKTDQALVDLLPIGTLDVSSSGLLGEVTGIESRIHGLILGHYFREEEAAGLNIRVFDLIQPEEAIEVTLFEQEKSAFTALLPTLMQEYRGHFVAIHEGLVVDSDRSSSELTKRFFRRFGDTHVYIGYVGEELPVSYAVSPFNL